MCDHVPWFTERIERRVGAVDRIVHRVVSVPRIRTTLSPPRAITRLVVVTLVVGRTPIGALPPDSTRNIQHVLQLIFGNAISAIHVVHVPESICFRIAAAEVIWLLRMAAINITCMADLAQFNPIF